MYKKILIFALAIMFIGISVVTGLGGDFEKVINVSDENIMNLNSGTPITV